MDSKKDEMLELANRLKTYASKGKTAWQRLPHGENILVVATDLIVLAQAVIDCREFEVMENLHKNMIHHAARLEIAIADERKRP